MKSAGCIEYCNGHCANPTRCGACYFQRNRQQLQDRFPWIKAHEAPFRVGCSVCQQLPAGKKSTADSWRLGEISSYDALQLRKLEKHEGSKVHQQALDRHADVSEARAPTVLDFTRLAQHMRKQCLGKDGLPEVGGQKKCRKMAFCLAEVFRESKRDLWRTKSGLDGQPLLVSTTLFQDARKGRLAVRFTAASSAGSKISGHMGSVRLSDGCDSVSLTEATMKIIRNFCTPCTNIPHLESLHGTTSPMDQGLFEKVKASIETFVSDSASDELRAGFMLAEQTTSGLMVETLPQLKVVMRDRPHATRRNLSRNWKADAFLDEVANAFLFAGDSPVRMIQYSHIFRDWFCESIRRQNPNLSCVQVNDHMKNLNFAPHRFESTAAPLTRVVLFFPAFLQTLSKIALQRKAEDAGKSAAKFLTWLDYERCVQVAMLGDCAIENLELTRLVDFEGFPVEDFPGQLISFRARIRSLFTGDAPACLDTGLTWHMLKILGKRTMAFNIPSSRGGLDAVQFMPTDERAAAVTVGKCLSRMSGWVALTERTLEAEFPHFEAQQSFKIFSLSAAAERPNGSHFCRSKDLSRLLKAYCLPEPDLQSTIADQASRLWYVARRTAMEEKLNSVDCWISAVKQATRTNTPQTRSSVAAVLPILVRYWAAGGSTSGVEQAFSRSQQLTDNLMIDGHIDDVLEASLAP